ncbi:hypothetical protein V8G54_031449, partial [Vigna mungo]
QNFNYIRFTFQTLFYQLNTFFFQIIICVHKFFLLLFFLNWFLAKSEAVYYCTQKRKFLLQFSSNMFCTTNKKFHLPIQTFKTVYNSSIGKSTNSAANYSNYLTKFKKDFTLACILLTEQYYRCIVLKAQDLS